MTSLVLSRDEVRQLARTPRKVRQAAFLRANGIRYYLDAHGWPVVLRSAVEGPVTTSASVASWKPNKAA